MRTTVRAASPVPLGIRVPVLSSASIIEPGVFGVFRPVLLLPDGIGDRLAPAELQAILAHELCHVQRRDNLATAMHMLVEALFWFHPLVWWLGARLMEERERACDEEVLRRGSEPQAYAEGILKVCEHYLQSPLKCVAGVTGANLKRRIEEIMSNRPVPNLNFAKTIALAVAGIAAAAAPIVVGVLKTPVMEAQSKSADTPTWEVVSIKPCEPGPEVPGRRSGGMGVSPKRLHVSCASLNFLIQSAYAFADDRDNLVLEVASNGTMPISGGPAWMRSDRYDIEAKAEGNPSAQRMQGPMLRALLEDRFKLKVHLEAREGRVYELTVAKSGFKLQPMK